jgi:hypothetical protein
LGRRLATPQFQTHQLTQPLRLRRQPQATIAKSAQQGSIPIDNRAPPQPQAQRKGRMANEDEADSVLSCR